MPRTTFLTSFGRCGLSWGDAGFTGFELPEACPQPDDLGSPPSEIEKVIARVQRHLADGTEDFSDLRFDLRDEPPFHAEVLLATLKVKAGRTCSYGEIATALGLTPAAGRAVGAALGANRWPLLIPCHRVVAADGKMTGFSGPGGVKTKLRLLALEGAQLFAE